MGPSHPQLVKVPHTAEVNVNAAQRAKAIFDSTVLHAILRAERVGRAESIALPH